MFKIQWHYYFCHNLRKRIPCFFKNTTMFEFHFVFLLYVAIFFQYAFLDCNLKKRMEAWTWRGCRFKMLWCGTCSCLLYDSSVAITCWHCISFPTMLVVEQQTMNNEWVKRFKGVCFGAYSLPLHQILLEYFYFNAMWIHFLWCGKLFFNEAQNILPRGQGFNMKTQIVLAMVIIICSNGASNLQH
jgi:hypothetical protein